MNELLKFLFEGSQLDADLEAALTEAAKTERLKTKKSPLAKALKALGIASENIVVDAEGCMLTVTDSTEYHQILKTLGTIEAVDALAGEGWVCAITGDVADTTELPEYRIYFIALDEPNVSDQDAATPVAKFNKEIEAGADTRPNPKVDPADPFNVKEDEEAGKYSVIVGNIGTVYTGNGTAAKRHFAEYVKQSKSGYGRAGGESVYLMKDGEPVKEYGVETGDEFHESNEADALLPEIGGDQANVNVTPESHAALLDAAKDVTTAEAVGKFFDALLAAGINFHPDTSFETYEDTSGKRVFTDDEATLLNAAMEQAFSVEGVDPYELGADKLHAYLSNELAQNFKGTSSRADGRSKHDRDERLPTRQTEGRLTEISAHVGSPDKFPHLARFLADHFGGYDSAADAAHAEGIDTVDSYVAQYTDGVSEAALAAADAWLAGHPDIDAMRAEFFDDAGNINSGASVPAGLVKIIKMWN